MNAPAPIPQLPRGVLLQRQPDSDVFLVAGHLTRGQAGEFVARVDVIGFTARLEAFQHIRVFGAGSDASGWWGTEPWVEAVTPEELARTDLVPATKVYAREVWWTRGRWAVLSP